MRKLRLQADSGLPKVKQPVSDRGHGTGKASQRISHFTSSADSLPRPSCPPVVLFPGTDEGREEGAGPGAHHEFLLFRKVGLGELGLLFMVQFHEVRGGTG